jgi:lipopolysaccharide/colanic/teichoic acid biosynthesis glycosyltransferase
MTYTFKDSGNATVGDILAFIDAELKAGAVAAVPASCLPVLVRDARCRPRGSGEAAGCFVFAGVRRAGSRCGSLERLVALLALAAAGPLLCVLAGLVWAFDGPSVLFRQERFGRDGAPFVLYKLRTMLRRSESLHGKLQRKLGRKDRLFKLDRDPRVTRLGGFLRRTFLDELPQLFNVVRGEMCFVGPRPLPQSDQGHYTQPYHALRLSGLPGLTGLWQISGRNERTFDEMCLLDIYYLCNRSAALDAHIVWRTLRLLVEQVGVKREA